MVKLCECNYAYKTMSLLSLVVEKQTHKTKNMYSTCYSEMSLAGPTAGQRLKSTSQYKCFDCMATTENVLKQLSLLFFKKSVDIHSHPNKRQSKI